MKIVVYAICKNEEQFVNRWYNSMKEADEIFVLDTGSTDNTVKLLKEKGVTVKSKKINPWRFDIARNESLKLLPKDSDVCVCTDLDEVFEKGWRQKIEAIWDKNTTRLRYTYNWHIDENNNPDVSFIYEKIHKFEGFKWVYPVHEVLIYNGIDNYKEDQTIVLNHYPDQNKPRNSYLPLLELSIKEDPNNDRNLHYLGREYMYYEKYHEAIDTLIKHLNLKFTTWKDERSASMRFIARSYKQLKRYDEAKMWLDKAITETPYLRDPYVERAILEYELENYDELEYYALKSLEIKNHEKTYINEPFSWNHTIYDLLSLCYYYKKDYKKAIFYIDKAILLSPHNERLLNNRKIFNKTAKNEK